MNSFKKYLESKFYKNASDDYYEDLNNFFQGTFSIGENKVNPDLGYVDADQKGIYYQDQQIGKLEVTVENGILNLENIRVFQTIKPQSSFRLGEKVLTHMKNYASAKGLAVQAEIVNDYLRKKFGDIFSDWKVRGKGNLVTATSY